MNPFVKTERKCNELVNNEFKTIRKSNSLHPIMRERKRETERQRDRERERAKNETNSPYSYLLNYIDVMNLLKSDSFVTFRFNNESHSL